MWVLINGLSTLLCTKELEIYRRENWCTQTQPVSLKHTYCERNWDPLKDKNQYAEVHCTLTMQVNYCSQEQLVCGTAKCRVPKGSLGISLSEYRLAIRAEGRLQNEFTSGPGCTLLWGDRGRRGRDDWWDRPWGETVSTMHHVLMLKIKVKWCRKANRMTTGNDRQHPMRKGVGYSDSPRSYCSKMK